MRAVTLTEFGPPDRLVLQDVQDPAPGEGQVLIKVAVASVTFVETQVRAGRGPNPNHRPELPMVPGNGVGGVVTEIGAGVDPALLGARVVSTTGGTGGYAELAAVSAAEPIVVPEEVELRDAVALLADGRTAVALTRAAAPAAGEWVLVEAAGGGVGSLLVQLAHAAGARVVAAAGGQRKLDRARELGAVATVDYREPGWEKRVLEETGGVHLVFDGVGGAIGRAALDAVRDGGRFCVHGLSSGEMTVVGDEEATARNLTVIGLGAAIMGAGDLRALSSAALAEAAAGRLRPTIGQILPLDQAAEAHAAIEARATLGKTLLIP